ncbi:hypothetical protein SAMD00019534_030550 [Acytostelium subglobosum LB1]|uniref:hypothetical protein n=1 Tax=Acytostelium subglobosum LB1 TaxID=1410327 RepID=UPI0006451948|nr:hypothetical protein SAMD00019534_030550 [Acytostelium subglobosum LB1]GAM19880.1 hypothetical protein SAMD00019534_030550 [Acytostelium subglobosum LB1]|eukprot:XP_012756642.1 hypothetical protein SAMD00019534_030550 [Acytostelium subglobosum LB1]
MSQPQPKKATKRSSTSMPHDLPAATLKQPQHNARLTSRQQSTLTSVQELYDEQKYTQALKVADTFLSWFPDNVECLSVKALILAHVGQKSQAYELAHQLIDQSRDNVASCSVAWHTLGRLRHQDRQYKEALECYHKTNYSKVILKDMLKSYTLARDLNGAKDTYISLLSPSLEDESTTKKKKVKNGKTLKTEKTKNNKYWIGLMMCYHLMGKNEQALLILDLLESSLQDGEDGNNTTSKKMEHSEIKLYRCQLLEDSKQYDQVLDILTNDQDRILEKQHVRMTVISLHY